MPGIHVLSQKRDSEDVDGRDIGVRKHAVLRTAMPGHDEEEREAPLPYAFTRLNRVAARRLQWPPGIAI